MAGDRFNLRVRTAGRRSHAFGSPDEMPQERIEWETGRHSELAAPEHERPFRSNRHGWRDRAGKARDVLALRPSDQDRKRRGMDVDLKRFFSRYLEAHDASGVPAVPIRVSALRALLSGIDEARPAPRIIRSNDLGFLVEDENPILCSASYPERPPNVHDSPDPDRGRDCADCFHRLLAFA